MGDKPKILDRRSCVLAESVSQTWIVNPAPGTPLERWLESDYYANVGTQMSRGDIIRIVDESTGLFAELLVREGRESNRQGFVSVALLRKVDLPLLPDGLEDSLPSGHSVQWLGESQRWAAMRGSQILRDSFATKSEALAYFGQLSLAGAAAA